MTIAPTSPGPPTVAVQLTAKGVGAIGVILITGRNAHSIIQKICRSPRAAALLPGQSIRSTLLAPAAAAPETARPPSEVSQTFDDALVVRVSEEAYELHVHGGMAVMTVALEALRHAGAEVVSAVEAGERGIFGSGIDGDVALAISNATTMTGLQVLARQKTGGLLQWARHWRGIFGKGGGARQQRQI